MDGQECTETINFKNYAKCLQFSTSMSRTFSCERKCLGKSEEKAADQRKCWRLGRKEGRKAVSLLGHCTVDISIGEDGPRMTCIFLTQNYVYETGGSDNAIVG